MVRRRAFALSSHNASRGAPSPGRCFASLGEPWRPDCCLNPSRRIASAMLLRMRGQTDYAAVGSAVPVGVAVSVERGRTPEMGVEHLRTLGEVSLLDEVDHALHRLALIDRVGDHGLSPRGET